MIWPIFLLFSGLFLTAAIHPFFSYPLSLLAVRYFRRRPLVRAGSAAEETFAICLCAYNEERVIEAKMRNLLELRQRIPTLDILVYVDAATDRTAELLSRYADNIKLHVSPVRHGKTHGMNLLVAMTEASIVVFTDANVMIAPEALPNMRHYFADPEIGCVCGHLCYINPDESVTAGVGSLYWRFEEWLKKIETETGSTLVADGSLYAIRRSLHHRAPDDIIDDMFVSMNIACDGHRVVQAIDVNAYEESVAAAQEEFTRKIRIACQSFNVHRLLWPKIRQVNALTVYKYVSHKLLRWFSIYSLGLSALCFELCLATAGLARAAIMLAASVALVLFVGRTWRLKPLAQIWDILSSFLATGIGVWLSLRGQHFQTWTPAASIRR